MVIGDSGMSGIHKNRRNNKIYYETYEAYYNAV